MSLKNWVVFTHQNYLGYINESDEIQILSIFHFYWQRGLFWIRIWLDDIETCLKSRIYIVRKSFLADIWGNYSFFPKKCIFIRTPKKGILRIDNFRGTIKYLMVLLSLSCQISVRDSDISLKERIFETQSFQMSRGRWIGTKKWSYF